jgi:acetolactate synthase-1/2/3 large subunit
METIDGGEILVRMLQAAGVERVFTLHGGHLDAIFQSAMDRGLKLVDTRHEQAAGHAADGWARTTGRVGVAIVTAGPGVTDVVTAVANAYLDCVPVLIIGGRSPLVDDERLPLQGGFSQVDMMKPITKWSRRSRTAAPARLRRAGAARATSGRPGPCSRTACRRAVRAHGRGLLRRDVSAHCARGGTPAGASITLPQRRPVIMAGGGAWFSGAAGARGVRRGDGCRCSRTERAAACRRPPCRGGSCRWPASALGGPDVVLISARSRPVHRRRATHDPGEPVIQVDVEGEEIGRNRDIDWHRRRLPRDAARGHGGGRPHVARPLGVAGVVAGSARGHGHDVRAGGRE